MKAYQKPVLYYEKFELSQHIASCDFKLNFGLGAVAPPRARCGAFLLGNFHQFRCGLHGTAENYCYTNSAAIVGTHTS